MLFRRYPYASVAPLCWQELPSGIAMKQTINQVANQWSQKFVGHHLLKLGALSAELELTDCFLPRQLSLSHTIGSDIRGDVAALPIGGETIDALISCCCLEFHANPHAILREMDRTLTPGGSLVLICFNPFSLISLGKCRPKYQDKYPWNGHFYSASRIKDWLALLNYQLIEEQRIFLNPMNGHCHHLQVNHFASFAGFGSTMYMLNFRKKINSMTPIKPKYDWRPTWQPASPSFCFEKDQQKALKKGEKS